MPDLIVSNIICFQTQKRLTTLKNVRVLLNGVLTDLRTRNFVHTKTSACTLVTVRAICRALHVYDSEMVYPPKNK